MQRFFQVTHHLNMPQAGQLYMMPLQHLLTLPPHWTFPIGSDVDTVSTGGFLAHGRLGFLYFASSTSVLVSLLNPRVPSLHLPRPAT